MNIDGVNKLRCVKAKSYYIELFNDMGANAIPHGISRVIYTALETGAVDGQEKPI